MPREYRNQQNPTRQHGKPISPRLPHEHDESTDSQEGPRHGVIKQAHDDIVSGKQDTDLHNSPGLDKPQNRPKK
ncbi:MAG: hypothetical protein JWL63_3349 [Rhodocyclales bacterium]|nr:hypothetical protein [Rhodocyclales bacterium]